MKKRSPTKSQTKSPTKSDADHSLRLDAEACELSLHQFVRQGWHVLEPDEPFADNWHIVAICMHLEAVAAGRIKEMVVNVPPGTMKSLLCCVFFPAWVWAKRPGKRFLYSSYSDDLSRRDSVKTRTLVRSVWYQQRWAVSLSDDQNTKGKFDTTAGGWRMIGSVRGRGIGEHPDFVFGDDVHNVLQAESEQDRQTVRYWVEGVFSIRGQIRKAAKVLIGQRLHAQDASAWCIEQGFVHLCFPMRYEKPERNKAGREVPRMPTTPIGFQDPRTCDGELLWPAKYSEAQVANLESRMGLYGSAAQLQQRPSPRGGAMFRRAWFQVLPSAPRLTQIVRYWDKAATKEGTGARSASSLVASWHDDTEVIPSRKNKWIILHVMAGRWTASERERIMRQTAESDRASFGYIKQWVEQEPGSGGKESAENSVAGLAGFTCEAERVTGAKEVRAEPLQCAASVGLVSLLAGAWNDEFLTELENFPMGKLKDLVDSAGGAFNKLAAPTGAFSTVDGARTGRGEFDQEPIEVERLEIADLS